MLKQCYNCEAYWDSYFNYCPKCGYPLEESKKENESIQDA